MTAEIINLRTARKSKTSTEKAARAAENRTAFGRTKSQRLKDEREKSKRVSELDGKRIDPSAQEDEAK